MRFVFPSLPCLSDVVFSHTDVVRLVLLIGNYTSCRSYWVIVGIGGCLFYCSLIAHLHGKTWVEGSRLQATIDPWQCLLMEMILCWISTILSSYFSQVRLSNVSITRCSGFCIKVGANDYSGKIANVSEEEMKALCAKSKEIFLSQPMLLELEAPVKICGMCIWRCDSDGEDFCVKGNTHGQYLDLLHLFECGGSLPETNYLFLGNYVDRGRQSLETICLLLAYKVSN
jgi:hypothetical protein